MLWTLQLITCITGTIMYVGIASDGHLMNPILKAFDVRKFSTGDMLIFGILLEDFPQLVLTAIIVSFYADTVTYGAVMNFTTAFYDLAIKLAEAHDEKEDVRHTGASMKNYRIHDSSVTSIAKFDDQTFLSASLDKTIKLVDLKSGRRVRAFFGHTSGVTCLCTIDQFKFLSGSTDNEVILWDRHVQYPLKTYQGHTGWVNSVAKLDDYRFVSVSHDKTTRVWSLHSGACLKILEGHLGSVTSVVGIDHQTILTASEDKTVKLWNTFRAKCLHTFKGHVNMVHAVTLLDTNKQLFLSGSHDLTVKMWNWSSGECIRTFFSNLTLDERVLSLAKVDSDKFICGYSNAVLIMWDINLDVYIQEFSGHSGAINDIALFGNGHSFVTASDDNTCRLWALKDTEVEDVHTCHYMEFVENFQKSESQCDIAFDHHNVPEHMLNCVNHLAPPCNLDDSIEVENVEGKPKIDIFRPCKNSLNDSNLELICTRSLLEKSISPVKKPPYKYNSAFL
uniref:Uncharacterized protein n=1 Tax=Corethron hystrix TaxID=216773 RepID=A0A7S1BKM7_9STRA|mmetsp:Transcript_32259/g.74272  ORF Transcript_32259/g.74272 Transcript_32259/m.74272 type:complete len:506 (+) Transcript_32259:553-2070(+)